VSCVKHYIILYARERSAPPVRARDAGRRIVGATVAFESDSDAGHGFRNSDIGGLIRRMR
jgi:hypothetical protein